MTERKMTIKQALYLGTSAIAVAAFAIAAPTQVRAQAQAAGITIDGDDIGGVVTGPRGAEAGVWVIAETNDLGKRGKSRGGEGARALAGMSLGRGGVAWQPGTAKRAPRAY